jgi:hypothetical protein
MTEINWFFAPALGSRRYTIRYRVRNAVRTEESATRSSGTPCLPTSARMSAPAG